MHGIGTGAGVRAAHPEGVSGRGGGAARQSLQACLEETTAVEHRLAQPRGGAQLCRRRCACQQFVEPFGNRHGQMRVPHCIVQLRQRLVQWYLQWQHCAQRAGKHLGGVARGEQLCDTGTIRRERLQDQSCAARQGHAAARIDGLSTDVEFEDPPAAGRGSRREHARNHCRIECRGWGLQRWSARSRSLWQSSEHCGRPGRRARGYIHVRCQSGGSVTYNRAATASIAVVMALE